VLPAVVVRGPTDDLEIRPIIDFSLRDFTPSGDESRDVADLTRLIMRSWSRSSAATRPMVHLPPHVGTPRNSHRTFAQAAEEL